MARWLEARICRFSDTCGIDLGSDLLVAFGVDIEFSQEELKSLVKALRIADWVSNSRAKEAIGSESLFSQIQQKVYKAAADAGLKDTVCYDFGSSTFEEHPDFDVRIFEEIIDHYDDASFWDGLVDRLVIRAMEESYGPEIRDLIAQNPDYRMEERDQLADLLRSLMERDGIYALHLQPGWTMPEGLLDGPESGSFDPKLN